MPARDARGQAGRPAPRSSPAGRRAAAAARGSAGRLSPPPARSGGTPAPRTWGAPRRRRRRSCAPDASPPRLSSEAAVDDSDAQEVATRAAFRAGRLAVWRLGDPGYLKWKGHRDVVSGASLDVQDVIVSILQKECAGDAILVEEGPEDEPLEVAAERLWIVDPICGSLNFVQGIPFFAVSIALRVAGQLRV
ncbi:MAG: hypothetical protein E6J15_03680, partial [Chloroflexi bacterium]